MLPNSNARWASVTEFTLIGVARTSYIVLGRDDTMRCGIGYDAMAVRLAVLQISTISTIAEVDSTIAIAC